MTNHQEKEVLRISWKVAEFFRRSIPAGCIRSNCPPDVGPMSQYLETGPLHYGPSDNPYDTKVYKPDQKQTADATGSGAAPLENASLSSLVSHVHVDIRDKYGNSELSDLKITSEFDDTLDMPLLKYKFVNNGKNDLSLHLNMTKTPEFSQYFVYGFEKPIYLESFGTAEVSVPTDKEVVVEPAQVFVWDGAAELAAIGSAGVYTINGGSRDLSGEQIWDLIPAPDPS
ncbi:MAG: hypothetical protein ACRD1R_09715 [Acidobacteriota bacterium]